MLTTDGINTAEQQMPHDGRWCHIHFETTHFSVIRKTRNALLHAAFLNSDCLMIKTKNSLETKLR